LKGPRFNICIVWLVLTIGYFDAANSQSANISDDMLNQYYLTGVIYSNNERQRRALISFKDTPVGHFKESDQILPGYFITRIEHDKIVIEFGSKKRELRIGSPYQSSLLEQTTAVGALTYVDGKIVENNSEIPDHNPTSVNASPLIGEGALTVKDGQVVEIQNKENIVFPSQDYQIIPQGALVPQHGLVRENPADIER